MKKVKEIITNKLQPKSPASPYDRSIRFNLLLLMSFKSLTFKKLRTVLTIAGVLVGIAAIVFLASLGLGLQKLVTEEVVDSASIRTIDVSSAKSTIVRLDETNVKRIRELPNIKQVGKGFTFAGKVDYNNSTTDTVVYGMDKAYMELSTLNLVEGTFVTNFEAHDAMVNTTLLKVMGIKNNRDVIGKELDILAIRPPKNTNDKTTEPLEFKVKVIGVVETGSGTELFTTNRVFENAGTVIYTQLKVVAHDQKQVAPIRQQIEALGFETESSIDTLAQVNQIFRFFTFILVGFGMTGMFIAVLGMLNTLTISLLERTREIALMVTLGARAKDIRRLFVIEALFLALGGGIAGITVAWLTGKIVDLVLTGIARSRGIQESINMFVVPAWLVLMILVFVVFVGLAVVYFPARRAERISPVDALRNE